MLLLLVVSAFADDGVWVGGAASAVGGFTVNEQEPLAAMLQVEGNLNVTAGIFSADIDLDAHFNPFGSPFLGSGDVVVWYPDDGGDYVLAYPRPIEELELTVADGSWRVSGGLLNPAIGIETWDEWQNPLVTTSGMFAMQPGQIGGAEFGWTFGEEGPELSVYGGFDFAWHDEGLPAAEVGLTFSYSGDALGTYNGVWAMPTIDNYGALLSAEIYAAEAVTIDVSVSPGLIEGAGYVGGWADASFLPEAMLNPVVRVEGLVDPQQALVGLVPTAAAEVGANFHPVDFLNVQLAGRVTLEGQALNPGVVAGVSIFRPEPE